MSITNTQWKRLAECAKLVGRHADSLSHLKKEMTSRKLPELYDDCSKIRSDLLDATLHDVLPYQEYSIGLTRKFMPQSYHLIYFHSATRLSSLFPDGTDPLHSPGMPFTRRMWAGGNITFDDHLPFQDSAFLRCKESIKDVEIKGNEGDEKIFITIERRIGYMAKTGRHPFADVDPVLENRKLVFLRERPRPLDTPASATNIIKHPHEPQARHTFIPSPALLFRFSALTFNAHAIHLDKKYCQEVEGYRNLLVHGPLTVVLMLQYLTANMHRRHRRDGKSQDQVITFVTYRNLAPLYAEEEMTLCVRQKEEHLWETWIEGPDGGLAVKASVRTAEEFPMQKEREKQDRIAEESSHDRSDPQSFPGMGSI
ncbi:MAG: hypothetical protein Q9199_006781 [Rusavskia elegans]